MKKIKQSKEQRAANRLCNKPKAKRKKIKHQKSKNVKEKGRQTSHANRIERHKAKQKEKLDIKLEKKYKNK